MRTSARQRRHRNGSSNAAQDRPTPPATRPMTAPRSAGDMASASDGCAPSAAAPERLSGQDAAEKRRGGPSGAVTSRRPQTAQPPSGASRRRVHSARAESTSRVVRPLQETEAVASAEGQSTRRPSPSDSYGALPTLPASSRGPLAPLSQDSGASRSRSPTAEGPPATTSAPGVQWVVAVDAARPPACLRASGPGDLAANARGRAAPRASPTAFEEFGALLRDRYEGKRSLRAAFLNWDGNKDGRMSHAEVRRLIHTLGFDDRLGPGKVDAVLEHVAALPDASLSYEGFCRLISQPSGPDASASAKSRAPARREAETAPSAAEQALYPDVGRVVELLRRKYQTRKLRSVFRDWDGDKDGCVTASELDGNLRRQGVRLDPTQLRELFAALDTDGDGRLLYRDFVDLINGPGRSQDANPEVRARARAAAEPLGTAQPYPVLRKPGLGSVSAGVVETDEFRASVLGKLRAFAPRLNDAYAAFDDDHSGSLSFMEFRQGLQQIGLHFTEREFVHLATAVDTDGSGEISFKEFVQMVAKDRDGGPGAVAWPAAAASAPQAQGRAGSFDFSHLTRYEQRAKIPTRCGRTPCHDTGRVLRHSDADTLASRFSTEARQYGSNQGRPGASPVAGSPPSLSSTIGQEDKRRRGDALASRLRRMRTQEDEYNARTQQSHAESDRAQDRRVRTIQRQGERYQEALDQQHPRHERPQGKAVQPRSTPRSGFPWG